MENMTYYYQVIGALVTIVMLFGLSWPKGAARGILILPILMTSGAICLHRGLTSPNPFLIACSFLLLFISALLAFRTSQYISKLEAK